MTRRLPPDDSGIAAAAEALRDGKLVSFPTETVYGLGGDASSEAAVARIFDAKGRPTFNPLIVHLPLIAEVDAIAVMDQRARDLADAFWPGPLTMVLPRRPEAKLSRLVSAGLPSVAVRVPSHPLAHALLLKAGVPVAAPSANRSGTISPTRADHVAASLDGRIDFILDGGSCSVGVESTVIDLTGPQATVLRPGGVTPADLERVLGTPVTLSSETPDAPKSPGQLLSHYAPGLPVCLNMIDAPPGWAYLGFGPTPGATLNLSERGDPVEAAANLFAMLHDLDQPDQYAGIAVAPVSDDGLGLAINDRLKRAAAPRG